ncbi:organic solute transporter Ostalpha-domain-containing protein [Xylogone sp. PMI_703]|nr:organic solute transporter Ostalpha-domain-containing protein [Xylogone sp. PMI_703]
MIKCNDTLVERYFAVDPVWHGYSFRTLGWVLASIFAGIATMLSLYLIWRHAMHYSRPYEQRHITRILFMVPIYSIVSVLSYLYYWHAVYFKVIRDCYEAFAIASFFFLLCHYIAPDLHAQKDYFRKLRPKHWPWPAPWFKICCGPRLLRTPRSGLTWFNVELARWPAVRQEAYVWIDYLGRCFPILLRPCYYDSLCCRHTSFWDVLRGFSQANFAHIWIMAVEAICVIIAMYCLIAFYITLIDDIAPHKPFFKILSIKLVIFLCFWQAVRLPITLLLTRTETYDILTALPIQIAISVLTSTSILKTYNTVSYADLKVGLPTLLICIEMSIFAVMHLFAYPWKVYRIAENHMAGSEPGSVLEDGKAGYQGGIFGVKALMDAFNPWDLVKAFGRGVRWIFIGRTRRHEDTTTIGGHYLKPIRNDIGYYGGGPVSYQGSFGHEVSRKNGKPGRYSDPDDERGELLTQAQSNPTLANDPDRIVIASPAPAMIDHGWSVRGDLMSYNKQKAPSLSPHRPIGLPAHGSVFCPGTPPQMPTRRASCRLL